MTEVYGHLQEYRPGGYRQIGVSVWKINAKSPAAIAGLKVGDCIESVDGEMVYPAGVDDPVSHFAKLLAKKKKVTVTVIRDIGTQKQKTLKLTLKRP